MSRTATTTRRERRQDMRRRTKRRIRGGEGLAPLWLQSWAQSVLVGLHRVRATIVRFFAGDKPFLLGFLGLLVVGALIISGPLNAYLAQRAQLHVLEEQVAVIEDANAGLADRSLALRGDEAVELRAREELGLIMPGEVPYVVVPPAQDRPEITTPLDVPDAPEPNRLEALWNLLTGLFG